jgi:NhaP-type Na+/H+ or K+/H+ antiporter
VTDFQIAVVLGGLLMFGAVVSGLAERSFLALTPLFVVIGFVLGRGGLGVLDFDPGSGLVEGVALTALIVILFRDGLEVEGEMLRTAWHLPVRKLVLAMPITAVIIALAAKVLTGLSWTEAFLLGALLSPTDPVLSSGVVTNPRVPRIVRHSLNLESGMNDGLALAPVLALSAALTAGRGDFVWWKFVLQDVGLGLVFGIVIGVLASVLLPRAHDGKDAIPTHQIALYALRRRGDPPLARGLLPTVLRLRAVQALGAAQRPQGVSRWIALAARRLASTLGQLCRRLAGRP